jgi:hypothetical protein
MEPLGLESLPRSYRLGLRLHALGADNALIAECLEIDPDGVVTLLDIGAEKLKHASRLAEEDDSSGTERVVE